MIVKHYSNEANCRLEEYVEQINQYKIFFDFETITSEYKHMPYVSMLGLQR